MIINPWDFSTLVFIPFLAAFILFLRRFHLRDTRGDRKNQDPFAPIALALAGVSLLPPITLFVLRMLHVFIPRGSVWFGLMGCALAAWAFTLQRRRRAPQADLGGPDSEQPRPTRPRQQNERRAGGRAAR